MNAHTPGPWKIYRLENDENEYGKNAGKPIITTDDFNNEICGVVDQDADARLISAAPELLGALAYLLEQTVDMDLKHGIELTEGEIEAREKAIAAIAKASGEE